MSTVQKLQQEMQSGYLQPNTVIGEKVKFIGPFLTQQLQQNNIRTIADLIRLTRNQTYIQIRDLLTTICTNQNANQCLQFKSRRKRRQVVANPNVDRMQGVPLDAESVRQLPSKIQYHVRDVNKSGYDTLRNLLMAARNSWPHLQHASKLPGLHVQRKRAASICGCLLQRNECEYFGDCQWKQQDEKALCIPRRASSIGFEGIRKRPGQKLTRASLRNKEPDQDYVGQWRVPS